MNKSAMVDGSSGTECFIVDRSLIIYAGKSQFKHPVTGKQVLSNGVSLSASVYLLPATLPAN